MKTTFKPILLYTVMLSLATVTATMAMGGMQAQQEKAMQEMVHSQAMIQLNERGKTYSTANR